MAARGPGYFDNFEDNLNDGATAFLDGPTAAVVRMLIDACAAGRVLLTCRYPVPGCMDALLEVAVGPLTAAETRRVFLRLQGLRELDRDDVLLVRSLIGGHPRALELLDALLRHGASVARVRTKLRELAEHEGIQTSDERDLASAIATTVRLAARDIVLDALVAVLDDTEREALLQIAVSTLPVEQDDLAVALATVATPQQLSIATREPVACRTDRSRPVGASLDGRGPAYTATPGPSSRALPSRRQNAPGTNSDPVPRHLRGHRGNTQRIELAGF